MKPAVKTKRKPATKKAPVKSRADLLAPLFSRIAQGDSLRKACEFEGLVRPTVLLWIDQDAGLADQYARAMLSRADAKFEELDDVSEEALSAASAVEVQGLRLKADNIKWQIARMNHRKYGDKLAVGGADDLPPIKTMPDEALDARIAAILNATGSVSVSKNPTGDVE